MLRFKELDHHYQQPRISLEGDGAQAVEDSVVRVSKQGWRIPFMPQSDIVISEEDSQSVGPAAQAAWVTTRAVIDPILLGGLNARGADGAAS